LRCLRRLYAKMVVEWEHFVAGTMGGFTSTLILHPLDLLKIRFAVNEGNMTTRPQYRSYLQAAQTIVRQSGRFTSLYQGVGPNLIGSTTAWGTYFLVYNSLKDFMVQHLHVEQLSARHSLIAGFGAGSFTLLLTNPIWVAKTRMCLQYEHQQRHYTSLVNCLWSILRKEGLRGWYKGFVAGLFGTSHGALQFMAYDEMKRRWGRSGQLQSPAAFSGALEHLTFAALSKMFADASTYPYQVIRARLQDQHADYKGIIDVITRTWRGEGILGFYKGLGVSLARVLPATCITFFGL